MPSVDMSRFAGWCSSWRKADKDKDSAEIPLVDKVRSVPELVRCDISLMLQLFALGAALTLFPYMGPDGLLKEPTFSASYRLWVSRVFPIWWIIVCMGVPCSVWGRWWFEVQFGRLSTHLGMLGISLLVIMDACTGCYCLAKTAFVWCYFFLRSLLDSVLHRRRPVINEALEDDTRIQSIWLGFRAYGMEDL